MTRATIQKLVIVISGLTLNGCSAYVTSIQNTVEYAIFGPEDITLSEQEIEQLPYATQYVTIQGQPRAALVLGYDDNGLYTWVSADNEALLTRAGRIVSSHGLDSEFDAIDRPIKKVTNHNDDPLACLQAANRKNSQCDTHWQASVWVGEGVQEQKYQLHSQFTAQGQEQLQLPNGDTVQAERWREQVTAERAGEQWQYVNNYWITTKQPRVVQSSQQLVPVFPSTQMVELKQYSGASQGNTP